MESSTYFSLINSSLNIHVYSSWNLHSTFCYCLTISMTYAPVIWTPNPTQPRHGWGKVGIITSHSPACVSLGSRVNTRFHFFIACWFSDGLKLSRGGSEWMTGLSLRAVTHNTCHGWAHWMLRVLQFTIVYCTLSLLANCYGCTYTGYGWLKT